LKNLGKFIRFSVLVVETSLKPDIFSVTMEFPPEVFEVYSNAEFETAAARLPGPATMELLVQARDNGRCMDHFRIALGGSSLLEASVPLNRVFNAPSLKDYKLRFQFWARDIRIRRNMSTSTWSDAYAALASRDLEVTKNKEEVEAETILEELNKMADPASRGGAFRYAVVVGPDQRLYLELVGLPCSAAGLAGKPAFVG